MQRGSPHTMLRSGGTGMQCGAQAYPAGCRAHHACLLHQVHELHELPDRRLLLLPRKVLSAVVGMQRQVAPELQAPQMAKRLQLL